MENQMISTIALAVGMGMVLIMGVIFMYYLSINPFDVNELFVMP